MSNTEFADYRFTVRGAPRAQVGGTTRLFGSLSNP